MLFIILINILSGKLIAELQDVSFSKKVRQVPLTHFTPCKLFLLIICGMQSLNGFIIEYKHK